jgi:tetratricopeptide (TPR) repeat protein
MTRGLSSIAAAACLAAFLPARDAGATAQDDLAEFQLAMNAYDTGEYETAEERFKALLDRDPPLDNRALIFEIYKYLGATLMFQGKKDEAEALFEQLLREDPDYELDPVLFPTDILDTFYKVKLRIADELAAIQAEKEKEAAKAAAEKAAMKKKLIESIKEASKPVYLGREQRSRSLFFAFVPFGVGQLQNGHALKGYLFLGGELALLGANITLWGLSEYYRKQVSRVTHAGRSDTYKGYFESLKLATNIMGAVVIAAMVAGVIDALIYYAKLGEGDAWKTVDPDEVPPDMRKKPFEIPEEDLDILLGFSWKWSF